MSDPIKLTDSLGREIILREMNIEDQLDLMEALGENTANPGYVNFASLIYLVDTIDGMPLPKPSKKEQFRRNAVTIKNEGMAALLAYAQDKGEADATGIVETAKN